MQKKIVQIIFRSQKSEVIGIDGILPALSLRFYAGVRLISYMCVFVDIQGVSYQSINISGDERGWKF